MMAGVVEIPSQPQIHPLFDAVKSEYGSITAGLNTYLTYDPFSDEIAEEFYPAISGSALGKGSFSFYGKNTICNGSHPFDYGMHKLFIKNKTGKFQFSTGIGYDYDGKRETEVFESIESSGNTIVGKNNCLIIEVWDENSIFGNINGFTPIDQWKKMLFGVEMVYSAKRGMEYQEQSEYARNAYIDSRDDIQFYNYDNGAYSYVFKAGAGLLKEFISKRGNRKLSVITLIYQRNREHSALSVIENVHSSFFQKLPDNIQFSGKDNFLNSIALDFLLSERDPDAFYLNDSKKRIINVNLKSMNIELAKTGIRNKTRSLNQWNTDDTYFGIAERNSTHYPLTLKGDAVSEIQFFSCFHLRLQTDIDGMLEFYARNKVIGKCILHTIPSIGCTQLIKNEVLIDLNFSNIDLDCGILGDMNQTNFGLDLLYHYIFQLRISLVKGMFN
jgi:hypothetical protein